MIACILAFLLLFSCCASCIPNGAALTPILGWSTWNTFRCDFNSSLLMETADLMESLGLLKVGYKLIAIDDCWMSQQRDSSGNLVPDPVKFPEGFEVLVEKLHSRGFQIGLYASAGPLTCQSYPGSWSYASQDVELFRSWGIDFLKVDACHIFTQEQRIFSYEAFSQALQNSSIFFSCSTSELITHISNKEFPSVWAPALCNSARVGWDIKDNWDSTLRLLDDAANLYGSSSREQQFWNDLDMLTVGMGAQTVEEYRTQFSLWSLFSSPLVMGADLRQLVNKQEILDILGNQQAIAINQDSLGQAGNLIKRGRNGEYEIWTKSISLPSQPEGLEIPPIPITEYNPWPRNAVVLFNRLDVPQSITLSFLDLYNNFMDPNPPVPWLNCSVTDVWSPKPPTQAFLLYEAVNVPAHGVRFLIIDLLNGGSAVEDRAEL